MAQSTILQDWAKVQADPDYQSLSPQEREVFTRQYLAQKVSKQPEYRNASSDQKNAIISTIRGFGPPVSTSDSGGLADLAQKAILNPIAQTVQGLHQGFGNTLTGQVAGALHSTPPEPFMSPIEAIKEIPSSFANTNVGELMSDAQYTNGALLGSLADAGASALTGLLQKPVTAAVGKVAAGIAPLAPRVAQVVAKSAPALHTLTSGGLQGGLTAAISGGNPQQIAENTLLGMGQAGTMHLAIAPKLLPEAKPAPVTPAERAVATTAGQDLLGEPVHVENIHPEADPFFFKPDTTPSAPLYDAEAVREFFGIKPPEEPSTVETTVPQAQEAAPSDHEILKMLGFKEAPAGATLPGALTNSAGESLIAGESGQFNPQQLLDFVRGRQQEAPAAPEQGKPVPHEQSEVVAKQAKKLQQQLANVEKVTAGTTDPNIIASLNTKAEGLRRQISALNDAKTFVEMSAPRPAGGPDPATVDANDHLNMGKRDLTPEQQDHLAGNVQESVATYGDTHKQRVTYDANQAAAEAITPQQIEKAVQDFHAKGTKPSDAMHLAMNNHIDAITAEAANVADQIAAGRDSLPPDELQRLRTRQAVLDHQTQKILSVTAPSRSAFGRSLSLLRQMNQQAFNANYWLQRADRLAGGYSTPDQRIELQRILHRGAEAQANGDHAGVEQARMDLAKAMGKLEQTGPAEAVSMVRKAVMLTGFKTAQRNMGGNVAGAVMDELSRIPAWAVDTLVSLTPANRGQRTVALPRPTAIARAGFRAAVQGTREAAQIWQHGLTEEELAKLEIPREMNTGIRPLDAVVNRIFRIQNMEDRYTYVYAFTRSIQDQAKLAGISEDQAMHNSVMVENATADAEFANFQNETGLYKGARAFHGQLGPAGKFTMDMFVPFKKTPAAIVDRVLDYAVIGSVMKGARPAGKLITGKVLTYGEQKTLATAFGRSLVGPALIYMGWKLAAANMMTGTYEPDQKTVNEAAGRTENSVKMFGHWVPIGQLSPVGNLLALGASLYRDRENPASLVADAAKTVSDQPMLQGTQDLNDFLKDPAKNGAKLAGSMVSSFVPALSGEVAQALDKPGVQRDLSKQFPQAVADAVKNKVPGLRNTLPEKVNVLGETNPMPAGVSAFGALAGRPAKEDTDAVVHEIVRLNTVLPKDDRLNLPDAPKKITVGEKADKVDVPLTEDLQRSYRQIRGQAMHKVLGAVMQDAGYQNLTDEEKKQLVEHLNQLLLNPRTPAGKTLLAQLVNQNLAAMRAQYQQAQAAKAAKKAGPANTAATQQNTALMQQLLQQSQGGQL